MNALRIVAPQSDAPDLDTRILSLVDAWDEGEAVAVGKALTAQESYVQDLQRRNRDEEKRLAAENAYRLARWTAIVMDKVGPAWHEWMLRSGATTLEKQTLYQYKSELLRIAPELQGQYNVYPTVYRAAALLDDTTQQANLLGAAEQMDMPAPLVRAAAKAMRDTGETDVPAFIPEYKGKQPDAPTALTEVVALCEEVIGELTDVRLSYGDDAEAVIRQSRRYKDRLQAILRSIGVK